MAFAYTSLLDGGIIDTLPSTVGALYTHGASPATAYVRSITLHNTNTTAEDVDIHLVPNSGGALGTAGVTNKIFAAAMDADATIILEFPAPGLMLTATNDSIQGVTTTASKVTVAITGGTE